MTSTTAWVGEHVDGGLAAAGPSHPEWGLGLALRRNPRRAHLLVNPVLAKHVPVTAGLARSAANELAAAVRAEVDVDGRTLVIGFAETATGTGQLCADALAPVDFITTTRVFDGPPGGGHVEFAEEHSHAVAHRLTPVDPAFLCDRALIVLVDDELSTGRTALNTIIALQHLSPGATFVVATLVDARPQADREWFDREAAERGLSAFVVGLDRVETSMPSNAVERVSRLTVPTLRPAAATRPEVVTIRADAGPLPRLGLTVTSEEPSVTDDLVRSIQASWTTQHGGSVHVLGDEEQIHLPVALAERLGEAWSDESVRVTVSSTTRSPILVVDDPGYPVRSDVAYELEPSGEARHAYNLQAVDLVVLLPEVVPGRLAALIRLVDRMPASRVIAVEWT